MNTNELLEAVLKTCRFHPTEETKAELFEVLADAYNDGESAYQVANDVCKVLGIDKKEFIHPLELLLRPEFERQ